MSTQPGRFVYFTNEQFDTLCEVLGRRRIELDIDGKEDEAIAGLLAYLHQVEQQIPVTIKFDTTASTSTGVLPISPLTGLPYDPELIDRRKP